MDRCRRPRADAAVCADPHPVHAGYRRYPQSESGTAGPGVFRGRQAARGVQADQPRVGEAVRHLAARDGCADRDGRPPLLRAPRSRLAAHRVGGAAHVLRRAPGRFDGHAATRAQSVPRRDRPRTDAHTQTQGSDHRVQDRSGLFEGRDSRNVSEHGAVSVQRVRNRNGGAHLFRQIGRRTDRAPERHADRHAEGQQLLQPGDQSRARIATPQHRAGADGEVPAAHALPLMHRSCGGR